MSEAQETGAAARALAHAAARTRWSALPGEIRDNALDVFIDTLSVMAAGSERDQHRGLQDALLAGGAQGPSTVLGRREGASGADAAFLNGTLPTVYQLDEGFRVSRGHPGIHTVPVALAIGEQCGSTADEVLSALVAGYEVAARIGTSLGGTRAEIHPHGNWGAVGAAVTAAWLFSHGDEATIARAIDIASGVPGFHDRRAAALGAGVHHLWAAIGAHTGYIAGAAAAAGMTPVAGALESYLLPQSGANPRAELLTDGISADGEWAWYAVAENYWKFFAACGHTHTAIGATLQLLQREPFSPEDVERVEIDTFRAAASLSQQEPANELAARYSIPAVVATSILDREFGLDALRPEQLESEQWQALAHKVEVRHSPQHDEGYPLQGRPLTLKVQLRDGRSLVQDASFSLGDPERAASREVVHDKARALLERRFGAQGAAAILDAALGLRPEDTLAELTAAFRSAA